MQAISRIAAIAALAAHCAYAQSAQPPVSSAQAAPGTARSAPAQLTDPTPAVIAHPPAPPELAPLSPDFQAAMANSQLQTYRYTQLTEQALALKKLCDTGFEPPDTCPKAGPASLDPSGAANPGDLPTVAEISGTKGSLSAVLVLSDGRHITVRTGVTLPGGLHVAAITDDDVRVSAGPGRETTLNFGGGAK
jgi:type IV pilus biogenesis protein PilP